MTFYLLVTTVVSNPFIGQTLAVARLAYKQGHFPALQTLNNPGGVGSVLNPSIDCVFHRVPVLGLHHSGSRFEIPSSGSGEIKM